MLFSHVKISSFRVKAYLVVHWFLYNNKYYYHLFIMYRLSKALFLLFQSIDLKDHFQHIILIMYSTAHQNLPDVGYMSLESLLWILCVPASHCFRIQGGTWLENRVKREIENSGYNTIIVIYFSHYQEHAFNALKTQN